MKRVMTVIATTVLGWWVVTTAGGARFEGPYQDDQQCNNDARYYQAHGYDVRTSCAWFDD